MENFEKEVLDEHEIEADWEAEEKAFHKCMKDTFDYMQLAYGDVGYKMAIVTNEALGKYEFVEFISYFFSSIYSAVTKNKETGIVFESFLGSVFFFQKIMKDVVVNRPCEVEKMLADDGYLLRFVRCFFKQAMKVDNHYD